MGASVEMGGGSAPRMAAARLAWLLPAKALWPRHLVEHRAEGEDVGSGVGLLALELLGGHVLERPQDRPLGREVPALGGQRGDERAGAGAVLLGKAEVHQLRPGLREHHVPRLQVAMDDPLLVRPLERIGDLGRVAQHLLRRQRAALQALGQRLALEQLHHEVVDPVLGPHVVERANVGMVEAGDGAGLALEALPERGVGSEVGGKDLDRDGALEPRVARAVDLAHPTRPQRREDLVGPEAGPRREGQDWLRFLGVDGTTAGPEGASRNRPAPARDKQRLSTLPPVSRPVTLMRNGENQKAIRLSTIDDRVGKPANDGLANPGSQRRARLRMLPNQTYGALDSGHERSAESGEPRLVEQGGVNELGVRLRMEVIRNQPRRRRTLARTSSPGANDALPLST